MKNRQSLWQLLTIATFLFYGGGGGKLSAQTQQDVTSTYLQNADFETNPTGLTADGTIYNVDGWTESSAVSTFSKLGTAGYGASTLPFTFPSNGSSVQESNNSLLGMKLHWDGTISVSQDIAELPAGVYSLKFDMYVSQTVKNAYYQCGVQFGSGTAYAIAPTAVDTWYSKNVTFILTEPTAVKVTMGMTKTKIAGTTESASGGVSPIMFIDNVKLIAFGTLGDAIDAADNKSVDWTYYIKNPSVNDNLNFWTNSNVSRQANNTAFGLMEGIAYAERWSGSGNWSNNTRLEQTLTGLPNGIYKLTVAAAFSRTGGYVYANTARTPIVSNDNLEQDYSAITNVTDGTLKIGIEALSAELSGTGRCYLRFDNFRLEYQGPETYVLFNQVKAAIATAQAKAELTVVPGAYINAVAALNAAIDAADGLTMDNTIAELQTAVDNLNSAITAADALIAKYAALKAAIDFANSFPTTWSGYSSFEPAIADAQSVYNNSTEQDAATLNTATAAITDATRTYRLTQPADFETPANFTFAIVNPQFDNDITDWNTNMGQISLANTLYNGWTKDSEGIDLYTSAPSANNVLDCNDTGKLPWYAEQTIIGLPEGYYRAKVVARGGITETVTMFIEASTPTATGRADINRLGDGTDAGTMPNPSYGWSRYELPYIKVGNGEPLTLGVEVTAGPWASADNFELWYYGNTLTDLQGALLNLQAEYEKAQTAKLLDMNSSVLSNLANAITAAENAYNQTISTIEDMPWATVEVLNDLTSQLQATTAAANVSAANYNANYAAFGNLLDKISLTAYKYFDTGFEEGYHAIYSIYEDYSPLYQDKAIEATTAELTALQNILNNVLSEVAVGAGIVNATNLVANATTDAAPNGQTAVPTGWKGVERGNTYTTSGQYFGDNNKTYFDSWAGSNLKFTVNQTVSVPAGSYIWSSEARTSGVGSYVYADVNGEYYFTEITNNGGSGGSIGNGFNTIYVPFIVADGGANVVLGITNNKAERLGDAPSAVAFTGQWYSATNFQLLRKGSTYTGDNSVPAFIGDITNEVDKIDPAGTTLLDFTQAVAEIPVVIANDNANLIVLNASDSKITVEKAINVIDDVVTNSTPVAVDELQSFKAPSDLYAPNGITYIRNSTVECGIDEPGNTSGWQSIILPFNVTSITAVQDSEAVTLIPFVLFNTDDYTLANNCRPFWLFGVDESGNYGVASSIEANKPYLFAVPNSADYNAIYNINGDITFHGTMIASTPDSFDDIPLGVGYSLRPTFDGAESRGPYALDATDGSRWVSGLVNSFHIAAWSASPAPYIDIFKKGEGGGDDGVGIKEILAPYKRAAKGVYTIDGRRIATDSLPDGALPAGIYIIDGEKVVIK